MATFQVFSDRIEVKLSFTEKLWSCRFSDIVIPLESVTKAFLTDQPRSSIRGVRAPGADFVFKGAYGTWRFKGGKDFLLLRSREDRAVIIDLVHDTSSDANNPSISAQGYSRVIFASEHAVKLVKILQQQPAPF